jgi:hypothetical protein
LKAEAPFKKRDLVAVNIHCLVRGWSMQADVVRQALSGHKRKCRSGCFTDAAMTLRADINLLLSW